MACENDCDYVSGIDARKMHIEQARLVFELDEIPRASCDFARANVLVCDLDFYGPSYIVLCLGFFYHVNHHVELLDRISTLDPEVLLIDTFLWKVNVHVQGIWLCLSPRAGAWFPPSSRLTGRSDTRRLQGVGVEAVVAKSFSTREH